MRTIKPGRRSLRRRHILSLAAAMLILSLVAAWSLGSAPAVAQGGGGKTLLLMSDGAVVCSEELGSVLASRLANSWSKDSLVDLGISWPDSYFRPKHVAAVISVSRCPKDAIVMEGYGY